MDATTPIEPTTFGDHWEEMSDCLRQLGLNAEAIREGEQMFYAGGACMLAAIISGHRREDVNVTLCRLLEEIDGHGRDRGLLDYQQN